MERFKDTAKVFLRKNRIVIYNLSASLFSILLWTLFLNLKTACFIFLMLLVHENSHRLMAKHVGIKTEGIRVNPGFGMYLIVGGWGNSFYDESRVILAGPMAGIAFGLLALGLYRVTGNLVFAGFALLASVVHAVNFLPIFPLDGARIIRGILASISRPLSRALVWAGPLFAIGITVLLKKPVFLVLLFVSLVNRRDNLDAKKMEPLQTLSVWFLFFGLLLLDILLFIWAAEPFIGNVEALKHVIRH